MTALKVTCEEIHSINPKDYINKLGLTLHLLNVNIEDLAQEIIRKKGTVALLDCISDDEIKEYLGVRDE